MNKLLMTSLAAVLLCGSASAQPGKLIRKKVDDSVCSSIDVKNVSVSIDKTGLKKFLEKEISDKVENKADVIKEILATSGASFSGVGVTPSGQILSGKAMRKCMETLGDLSLKEIKKAGAKCDKLMDKMDDFDPSANLDVEDKLEKIVDVISKKADLKGNKVEKIMELISTKRS